MKKKKRAAIVDAHEVEGGAVRLTFTRPHGVLKAGAVLTLAGGPHTVVSVQNKFILTVRKWPWYQSYAVRMQIIWRMLAGKPRGLRERLSGLFGKGAR